MATRLLDDAQPGQLAGRPRDNQKDGAGGGRNERSGSDRNALAGMGQKQFARRQFHLARHQRWPFEGPAGRQADAHSGRGRPRVPPTVAEGRAATPANLKRPRRSAEAEAKSGEGVWLIPTQ